MHLPIDDMYYTGLRLRAARALMSVTAQELADAVGLNLSTICRYERGLIKRPHPLYLDACARTLCVCLDWLLGRPAPATSDQSINSWLDYAVLQLSVHGADYVTYRSPLYSFAPPKIG